MKKSKYSVAFTLKHTVPVIFRVAPKEFCILYGLFFMNGVLMAVGAPCTQFLFDRASISVGNVKNLPMLVGAVFLLFGVKLAEMISSYMANFMGESYDMKSYGVLYRQLQDKACLTDPQYYEDPAVLLALSRARDGVRSVIRTVNVFMDIILNYAAYFLVILVYFVYLHPALLLVMVIIFATVLLEQRIKVEIYAEEEEQVSKTAQKMNYYDTCICDRAMAKETRVLGIGTFFLKKLHDCMKAAQDERTRSNKKIAKISLILDIGLLLEYAAIVSLMLILMMQGILSAGGFVAIFKAVDEIFDMLENLLGGRLGDFAQHYGKINCFFDFMYWETSQESKIRYETLDVQDGGLIRLSKVSYQYPTSGQITLRNIDFTIRKGETIALVGENGSGKSTLAKLLTGMLSPTEGTIIYDESLRDRKNKMSAVFQNYNRYPFSVKDSICFNDNFVDEGVLEQAVHVAGLAMRIAGMEEGLQTQLMVEFGGVDLSGGEWQKLAIARALYKEHSFLVLDEPTSAVDPLAEIEMYRQIGEMVTDKTALIITHRLGCIKLADRVLVLKNGEIQGCDTHEELLHSCKYYQRMWKDGVMQ